MLIESMEPRNLVDALLYIRLKVYLAYLLSVYKTPNIFKNMAHDGMFPLTL